MRSASARLILPALAILWSSAPQAGDSTVTRAGESPGANDPLAGWLEDHSEERARLGDHREDARLPDVSPAALARVRGSHPGSGGGAGAGNPGAAVDNELRVAADLADLAAGAMRVPYGDASWYTIRLRTALEVPVRAVAGSSCGRATRLAARLRAVPEFLRRATLNLSDRSGKTPGRSRTGAALALQDIALLLEICRTSVPEAFEDCRESRVQADLAEADSTAVHALEGFRDFVRDDLLPVTDVDAIPPHRSFGAWRYADRAMPDSATGVVLLARLRRELGAFESAPPPADTATGNEPLGLAVADAELDSIRATLSVRRFAGLGVRDRVDLSARSPLPGDIAPLPLAASGPWEPGGVDARLELGGWPAAGSGALAHDPRRSRASLELCLVREGLPGRALWALAEARQTSRERQALGLDAVRDAWARYAESLWVERGASPDMREALAAERRRLEHERLARATLELMLRVEHVAADHAAAWIAEHAGLTGEEAARAVLLASGRPTFAASTAALWGLEGLRADLEREMGARFSLEAFHEAVMHAGAIPIADLRDEVRAAMLAPPRRR